MKFYISSRFKRAKSFKLIAKRLEALGHSVAFDWTRLENVQPYDKNSSKSKKIAGKFADGIKKCDVFVILTDRSGTGMHTEFGIAYAARKKIFVVGRHLNTNIFFFLPGVKRIDSIKSLLKQIKHA